MKLLVFGSRKWLNQKAVERELAKYPKDTIIVHGAAPGADNIAGFVAELQGKPVRPYPANWTKFGLAAGPIRNQEMIDKEHLPHESIDRALCFHEDPNFGVGSKDMKARCDKAGIEVDVFRR